MFSRYFKWLQKDNPTGMVERYPEIDEQGQTSLKGVYIVGDLTGIPLIKLAADGGAKKVQDFEYDEEFAKQKGKEGIYDIVIIGAGPAGLSAAIECQKRKLSYVLLEASQAFNTIENFPKAKPILIRPDDYQSASEISMQDGDKESLLQDMKVQVAKFDINIKKGVFISDLKRENNIVKCLTSKREEYKACRVILAIGKSGNARKLGVKGEDLPHVFNKLYDPSEFSGKNILVVGGGDSALEATIALASNGNKVYHSYRKDKFARPKQENTLAFNQAVEKGSIIPLYSSQVKEIKEKKVSLAIGKEEKSLDIDVVFTLIGRELPVAFFKRSGIKIEGEKTASFWLFLICMLGFFSMLYFGKSSSSTAVFSMSASFADKVVSYLKAPFTQVGNLGFTKDTLLFCLAWVGSFIFMISGVASIGVVIKNRQRYFGTLWNKIKYTYFIIVGFFLTWVYIRYNIGADQAGWSSQVTQSFSLVYCITMLVFGIRRIMIRKTRYIKLQVFSLLFVQTFFLYLLPFHFYDWIVAFWGADSWFIREVLPDRWACFALILFWPLYITQFGATSFWTWFPFVQSGLFLFLIIRYFGKGVFCGWICSCGGMAETMGDEYRHLAPHGAKAKRYENLGQIILLVAVILTVLKFILGVDSPYEVPILGGTYKVLVDAFFAGVIGIGLYFFWGGRMWCRFGCPLAALMHIYTRFSKYRILSEKKKCISCNICTKVCHMGIDVMNYANKGIPMNDVECVRCSACIQSCPMEVLAFGSADVDLDNHSRKSVPSYGKNDWRAGIK